MLDLCTFASPYNCAGLDPIGFNVLYTSSEMCPDFCSFSSSLLILSSSLIVALRAFFLLSMCGSNWGSFVISSNFLLYSS